MPKCFCCEKLGGRGYFAPRTHQWNDWEATFEHYPIAKREAGRTTPDNAVLAHRLCNKLDHFIRDGLSIEKDLARVRKACEEAAGVETLEELLARKIVAEPRRWNRSTINVLSAAATRPSSDVPLVYEDEVFNFLLGNAKALAIAKVLRFKALLVDGAVELANGQRLAVEIKYKMNWRKACQAEWQFRNFLKRPEAAQGPVVGGLVFFNAFNEDWAKKPASRVLQNGWNYWYEGHSDVEGLALHLVRFSSGEMEVFPKAL